MQRQSATLWGAVLTILTLCGFWWVVHQPWVMPASAHDFMAAIRSYPILGPLLVILLMAVHGLFPFPGELILFAAMSVYGVWLGSVYCFVGSMIGSTATYLLVKFFGRGLIRKLVSPSRMDKIDALIDRYGVRGLLMLRLIPYGTYRAVNFVAGATRLPLFHFVWTTGIGLVTSTLLFAAVYEGLTMVRSTVLAIVILVVVVMVLNILWSVFRRRSLR